MTDLLDDALEWIDFISVFPCGADKKPLTKHGYLDASRDAAQVEKWFADPRTKLIGLPTGRFTGNDVFFDVIDIDVKEGKAGLAWLKPYKAMLQGCRCTVTPSGGAHYGALRGDYELRSSGGAVHDGVDIRADGGYVCFGPGYKILRPVPWDELPTFPAEVIEAIQKRHRTWDSQSDAALANKVKTATAFHDAVRDLVMRDALAGKTPRQTSGHVLGLLQESVAADPLHPRHARWQSFQGDEMDRMVEGAYDKARTARPGIGGKGLGGNGFDQESAAKAQEKAEPEKGLIAQLAEEMIKDYRPGDYVVEGVLQRGYLYSVTAVTGSGKTAVTLTICACVADGRPLGPHAVTQGTVFFLAGENVADIQVRLAALVEILELTEGADHWYIVPGAFDLKGRYDELAELIAKAGGAALIVVDTAQAFQSAAGMADQNSNAEMASFGQILRRLTELPGHPAVIVNSHPPKRADANSLEPAGGGAFINELDANLTLWDRGEGISTLHHTKLRGPPFNAFDWAIEPTVANLTRDREGRAMQTVIARVISEQEAMDRTRQIGDDENALLEDMLNWGSSSHSDRARRLRWTYGKTEAPHVMKVTRCFDRLTRDKLVSLYRGRFILTKPGRKEAERAMGDSHLRCPGKL